MDIKALFNQAAQIYGQTRRRYIPCFDQFYGTVLELIPYSSDAALHILDLGAGTGLLIPDQHAYIGFKGDAVAFSPPGQVASLGSNFMESKSIISQFHRDV